LLPRVNGVLPVDVTGETQNDPPQDAQDWLYWRETGRRHWPAYYRRLRESDACAAFGGYFVSRWPERKESVVSRALKRALAVAQSQSTLVSQWDSWRLWESLAAGCATIHIDFERYGCLFPEPPKNDVHYIGVDLRDIDDAVERITNQALLERVASQGQNWAIASFGPRKTAARLLHWIQS
jgi:hypothetical protein